MKKRRARNLENALESGANSNFSEIQGLGSGEKSPKKKQKFLTISGGDDSRKVTGKTSDSLNRVKALCLGGVKAGKTGEAEGEGTAKPKRAKVDVAKLAGAAKKKGGKALRSKSAKAGAATRKARAEGKDPKPAVVLPELENESSASLFGLEGKARSKALALLTKTNASKERKAYAAKLAAEFQRQYCRFRKVNDKWFKLHGKEARYMEEAAILCIEREITPARLIKYWAAHVERFHMRYPPPSFISSPGNIDAAASFYALNGLDADPEAFKRKPATNAAAGLHGYADTTQLHKGLRRELEKGGFDVSDWSDRDLMSIQNAAEAIARGRRLFVSSTMRPMVDRALRLYKKAGKP